MNKEQIINELIEENGYTRYLEIGYFTGDSYRKVECANKAAVDPAIKETEPHAPNLHSMTSDEFFAKNEGVFDIVLIDGLHHADQVRKDVINASKCLSPNGCIVLHDVNPATKDEQIVPRKQRVWTGNCWRTFVGFRQKYPDTEAFAYPFDHGVGVIIPAGKKFRAHFENKEMSYEEFDTNRKTLLGLI
ncbi:MAG: class I SAM-dependent methyltransferase [Sphingobacterium sp.]